MKMIIVVALALVAAASAVPVDKPVPEAAEISFNREPEGSYRFFFETKDGTQREEDGTLKEALDEDNKPHQVVTVRGSYTYINDEGKPETINYFADETGFHAEGKSVPKPV